MSPEKKTARQVERLRLALLAEIARQDRASAAGGKPDRASRPMARPARSEPRSGDSARAEH
jgi:hypothetical protein